MPTFLSGANRGWVKRLLPPSGSVGTIVTGLQITSCLITRAVVAPKGNFQFAHSLSNKIFVYTFGDRIGEMGIGGMAYFDCENGGQHGISNALDWYEENRIAKQGDLITLSVGTKALEGHVLALKADAQRPEDGLVEFYISMSLLPPDDLDD